jgi:hypothetical protein
MEGLVCVGLVSSAGWMVQSVGWMVFDLLDGRLICWLVDLLDGWFCMCGVGLACYLDGPAIGDDYDNGVDVLFSSGLVSRSNGWLWAGWKVWSARWMGFLWFGLLINCTF